MGKDRSYFTVTMEDSENSEVYNVRHMTLDEVLEEIPIELLDDLLTDPDFKFITWSVGTGKIKIEKAFSFI